jgi:hypothetical protein
VFGDIIQRSKGTFWNLLELVGLGCVVYAVFRTSTTWGFVALGLALILAANARSRS